MIVLKEVIRFLSEKSVQTGDPAYLRRRNQELSGELSVAQSEITKLKIIMVKDLQAVVEDLKRNIREMKSPLVSCGRQGNISIRS